MVSKLHHVRHSDKRNKHNTSRSVQAAQSNFIRQSTRIARLRDHAPAKRHDVGLAHDIATKAQRRSQRRIRVEELTLLVGRTQRDVTELVGTFAKGHEDAIDFNNAYPDHSINQGFFLIQMQVPLDLSTCT